MKDIQDLVEALERADLWTGEKVLDRNAFLSTRGAVNTDLFFICSGSIRAFVVDAEGEKTIRLGYPNTIITAMDSFLTGRPSNFYLQALKRTKLKYVDRRSLKSQLHPLQESATLWPQILQQLVLDQLEREQDLMMASPLEHYKRVQRRSPRLFQEIPHKYIADYLRMTPETLSRIKKS